MAQKLSQQLAFSDEQSMLLDTAVEFFRDQSPSAIVRELIGSPLGFDEAHWQQMVDLGWLGLLVPEDFGGSGLGLGAASVIAEPMGRHLSATPFLATQLFIQGLVAAQAEACDEVLPQVVNGARATVALSERDGDWDLMNIAASAETAGDRVQLSGHKTLVLNADVAQYVLVSVQYEGSPALVVVNGGDLAAGVLAPETLIDETRRSFSLSLDGLSVSASALITGPGALNGLVGIRDAALLLLSAEACGGTAGVLELIVEYLNTREAFGRKIGSYQGLKHPSVDILVGLERSRSHLYHAATLLDRREDAQAALRMAKAQSSDAFAFAGDRAIQFHGGFGFTYDCDAQLYLRRALWNQYSFGDAAHHRKHLAAALLD